MLGSLLVLLTLCCADALNAACAHRQHGRVPPPLCVASRAHVLPRNNKMQMMAEDSDDEIAALEEKLAALKRAKEDAATEQETAAVAAAAAPMVDVDEGFDWTTMSSRKKVASIQGAAPGELLSEAWKDEDSASEEAGSLGLAQIVGGVITTIALIAFAQVPVGQSGLDSVTYGGKEARLETPAEIRARYEKLTADDDEE